MATASNWQHDWAPAEGGGGRGRSFFLYAPATSGADNDVNVYAYEDDTVVTIRDVSTAAMTGTGPTAVDLDGAPLVLQTTLGQGEDLMVRDNGLGLDLLDPGRTYWVQATEDVTVQYGHLGQVTGGNQARDGAGFVPGANGSSAGSLFLFAIPHNPGRESEKELRVVCPEAAQVEVFGATSESTDWSLVASESVAAGGHLDLVGAQSAAFRNADLYRLTVEPPYVRCTVFEGNWMETGSYGTSDFASGVSSVAGTNLGHQFTAYVGPPGRQQNVVHPEGEATNMIATTGNLASHLYLYAFSPDTTVTIRDVDTGGEVLDETVAVEADGYFDFVIDTAGHEALRAGGRRPYVEIAASEPIMVMNGNFNDNWMAYFHSVTPAGLEARLDIGTADAVCGETIVVDATCAGVGDGATEVELVLSVGAGATLSTDDPTADIDGNQVTWVLGSVAEGAEVLRQAEVTLECSTGSCGIEGLVAVEAECRGTGGDDPLSSLDTNNLVLRGADEPVVESFTVLDSPGYDQDPPTPAVNVSVQVLGAGAGTTARLFRASADGDADAPQTLLATLDGTTLADASTVTVEDPYVLHYEEARFYRLEVEDGACSRQYGPVSVSTSSGASGGEDSGLESNGRLASALAKRAVARAERPGAVLDEHQQALRLRSTRDAATDAELLSMLPGEGPESSAPTNVTPGDLLAVTNAMAVASADYLTADGVRVASALVVETRGELYEHSRALCQRAAGATVGSVAIAEQPDGGFFRFTTQNERTTMGDYAAEAKLYQTDDGEWVVHAHWLADGYPEPEEGQRVLNVQTWSARPGFEVSLFEDVVAALEAQPSTMGEVPPAVVQRASVRGQSLRYALSGDATGLRARLSTRVTDGDWSERWLESHEVDSVRVDTPVAEATLELVAEDGTVVDRVWASDGAWTSFDDSALGGQTRVDSSSTDGCMHTASIDGPEELALDGCASVQADVSEFAGVIRHLGGGAAALPAAEVEGLRFWVQSSGPVRVCLEDPGLPGDEQACVMLTAVPEGDWVEVPRAAFTAADACAEPRTASISLVSFMRGHR